MSTSAIDNAANVAADIAAPDRIRAFLYRFCGVRLPWVYLLCDQVLVSGTSLLTTVFIGRCWGKQRLGLYVLAYSTIIVLLELQNSFIASPYTINIPKLGPPEQSRYTGDTLILSASLAVAASFTLLCAAAILHENEQKRQLASLLIAVASISVPLLVKEFGRRACLANLCTGTLLLLDALVTVVYVGGILFIFKYARLPVESVYWAMGVASSVAALIWGKLWRHKITLSRRGPVCTLRKTWSFGLWVLTGNLAFVVSQQLYPWLLATFKGAEATGAFAVCVGLFALINPLMTAVGNYLGPTTAKAAIKSADSLLRTVLRASGFISLIVMLFCVTAIVLGNYVIVVLYGPAFKTDVTMLAVLAVSVIVANCTLALGFAFWAMGRPDINLKINLISTGFGLAAGPILVSRWGILGAASGLLLGNAAVSLVRVITLKKVLYTR